ncbi:formate/nitrite transporter family protein [uncultured Acidaminococcus sp.]|uniref:formate/nitrite transporter family protein n=1 Tax=uncultured Acidaminococcus sp. TaxID=352152 RepID=UPI00259AD29C|nr:formate/nitrite transporter family protein [uncultured Acidaminococcus sp.]
MKIFRGLLSAVAAGFCIGLGGAVFLLQTEKLVGALLFCVGLYTICEMQFQLFTGRVCYALEQPFWSWFRFPLIWVGNWVGTGLAAGLLGLTRVGPAARQAALVLVQGKNGDTLLSLFLLGFFCNIFVFIAVEGYRTFPLMLGKYLAIFVGITVFIMSGYEHSIADMFYYFMAGQMDQEALVRLLVITTGNVCGGLTAWGAQQTARKAAG